MTLPSIPASSATSSAVAADDLRREARHVADDVRQAWLALIRAVPGGRDATRATHLSRLLNLSPKLGWQIWRMCHATSPYELISHLPGPQGIGIVTRAALKTGAPRAAVARAEKSIARIDELTRAHAGDRASLAMMLAPLAATSDDDRARSDEDHRRLAFLGASYLWGVQARVHLNLSILHPGATGRVIDAAAVRGVIDLRRLRPDLPWIITRSGCRPGRHSDGRWREPMTAASTDPSRAPLIEEFCSSPTPLVRLLPVAGSELFDLEVAPTRLGDAGSVTVIAGEILHNLPKYRTGPDSRGRLTPILFTPCERLIQDVLIHRGAEPLLPLRVNFFGDPRGDGIGQMLDRNKLPVAANVQSLGRGIDAVDTPHIPRYQDLVIRTHELLGWHVEADFDVYRVELTYPPFPCMSVVEFELPEG
jgi:hypothetical protein